jgi:predicted ester cyclase
MKTDLTFRHTLRRAALSAALLVSILSSFSAGAAGSAGGPAPGSRSEAERNKAVARRVYDEGLSQGKFEVPYTPGFVGHGGASTFRHEDGIREAKGWRSAFPDLRVVVDLAVAEGDLVSVRWTARGTNTGTGNGIPATGRKVQVSGTTIFRFEGGAIAEEWTAGDTLGLMRQLGLMPPSPASAPRPE